MHCIVPLQALPACHQKTAHLTLPPAGAPWLPHQEDSTRHPAPFRRSLFAAERLHAAPCSLRVLSGCYRETAPCTLPLLGAPCVSFKDCTLLPLRPCSLQVLPGCHQKARQMFLNARHQATAAQGQTLKTR